MTFLCPLKNVTICDNIPSVEYNTSWLTGCSYYADGIVRDNIFTNSSAPVVKFVDQHQRSFIAFKYNLTCSRSAERNGEYAVQALQLYSNNQELWGFCGTYAIATQRSILDENFLNFDSNFVDDEAKYMYCIKDIFSKNRQSIITAKDLIAVQKIYDKFHDICINIATQPIITSLDIKSWLGSLLLNKKETFLPHLHTENDETCSISILGDDAVSLNQGL